MVMNVFRRLISGASCNYSTITTATTSVRMGERVGIPTPVMSTQHLQTLINTKLPQLPFFVERTAIGKGLPVYSQLSSGNTQKTTIVRRVYGDVQVLAAWLMVELHGGQPGRLRVKPEQQKIIIKGDHVEQVKLFLTDLGF